MNKAFLIGRLTRNPDIRYTSGGNQMAIARFTLAVDRRYKTEGEQSADFITCVTFGKSAEFAEKYLSQGTKIAAEGRIKTGNYINKEGQKVYTTDVVIENMEFAQSKSSDNGDSGRQQKPPQGEQEDAGFKDIDFEDDGLPFN